MSEEKIRLSKLMSQRGICSRREADALIEDGLVYVDGEQIDALGTKVLPHVQIEVESQAKKDLDNKATILLNKPLGYVSAQPEEGKIPAIRLITEENKSKEEKKNFKPYHLQNLAVAGRLDENSTGLMVLTQSGVVARHLIDKDSPVEKEYLVRVKGRLSQGDLELLNHGLELDGKKLKPAKVSWLNEDQLRFILIEGKKRQIRRMCDIVNLEVLALKRVRIGKVNLGKLEKGQWRYLKDGESF